MSKFWTDRIRIRDFGKFWGTPSKKSISRGWGNYRRNLENFLRGNYIRNLENQDFGKFLGEEDMGIL